MVRLILVILLSLSALAGEPAPATREANTTWLLIARMGSNNPAAREQAVSQIMSMGRSGREVLVEALNSEDPQVRTVAAGMIVRFGFDEPDDPPGLVDILSQYGRMHATNRAASLGSIADAAGNKAGAVFLRLIRAEPSDTVRWAMFGYIRRGLARDLFPAPAKFDAGSSRAPNIALAGWAWEKSDYPRALRLYRRCLDTERESPSVDNGEADYVFQALVNTAMRDRRYDDAAQVYRVQYARQMHAIDHDDSQANPLDSLFYLHATRGPLADLSSDVEAYASQLHRPQLVYALARLYQDRAGNRVTADALGRIAFASSICAPQQREAVSEFLVNHRWDSLAEAELATMLALNPEPGGTNFSNAHLRMGLLRARQDDHLEAGTHKQTALEAIERFGGLMTRTRGERQFRGREAMDLMWAEVDWHYFRAAKAAGDTAAMQRHLDKLVAAQPNDEQIVLDIVPLLLESGRKDDAAKLFAKPYASLEMHLLQKPDDPERLNNLAWLCGRSGQRLDVGQRLIEQALAERPDNYAYLDTAAEIQFQLGNVAKAIELEERALRLKPGDPFLREQLERFRKR